MIDSSNWEDSGNPPPEPRDIFGKGYLGIYVLFSSPNPFLSLIYKLASDFAELFMLMKGRACECENYR